MSSLIPTITMINDALSRYSPDSVFFLDKVAISKGTTREAEIRRWYHPSDRDKEKFFSTLLNCNDNVL